MRRIRAASGTLLIAITVVALTFITVSTIAIAQDAPRKFVLHDAPKPLPDISFQDGNGKARSLHDFRGKFVLLNIWATWCAPCRKEMPTLDRLQAATGGPDFEVAALSIDRAGLDVVAKFYRELSAENLAMYIDTAGKAATTLGAVGLPTTLLIDRDGREIGRLVGPAEWDAPEMMAFIRSRLTAQTGSPMPAVHGPAVAEEKMSPDHDFIVHPF
jgi:thiol-disulfide isomerase/thioredoxin